MSQKHLESSSRNSIESCTSQLLSWRPFHGAAPKILDPSEPQKPFSSTNGFHSTPKRPCLSDRSTSFSIEAISRLSLADDDKCGGGGGKTPAKNYNKGSLRLVARKRRRRGSRSVSGRSSDRSGTRRCCSVGAHGTCSDFQFAVATDSSGELFGDASWASDVSEVRNSRRERDSGGGGSGEKEGGGGFGFGIGIEPMGSESGYGSEPGYRGDAEFGYGDEFDEEEEDAKLMFWGGLNKAWTDDDLATLADTFLSVLSHDDVEEALLSHLRKSVSVFGLWSRYGFRSRAYSSNAEVVGEKEFADKKTRYRCRRKKHDYKTVDSMR